MTETFAYRLRLQGTWQDFKASRPRNLKESLRRRYNGLRREGQAFALEVASAPEDMSPALERFFELHRLRSKLRDTVIHRNVFATAEARSFLVEECQGLARTGRARVFQLRVGGEIVASRVGFEMGDVLYLCFSGFDPRWWHHGVKTTTLAEVIRHTFERGLREGHLSMGTDGSKMRWRPEETSYSNAVLTSPTLRGRLARSAHLALRRRLAQGWLGGLVAGRPGAGDRCGPAPGG
jgi:CelD/BcsL family acetyltransferase involved in cellulose biosynthesis